MSKRRVDDLVNRVDSIVKEMHTLHFTGMHPNSVGWEPMLNVYSYPKHYEICAELAGVALEDIHILVSSRTIKIEGVRHWPDLKCQKTQEDCTRTTLMEIEDGYFLRELEMAEDVNANSVEMTARNGLVWIYIEKQA